MRSRLSLKKCTVRDLPASQSPKCYGEGQLGPWEPAGGTGPGQVTPALGWKCEKELARQNGDLVGSQGVQLAEAWGGRRQRREGMPRGPDPS